MSDRPLSEPDRLAETRDALVAAILPHAAFDGWTEVAFRAASADSGLDRDLARAAAPRGGIDLAVAFHKVGDRKMAEVVGASDLSAMKYRERVAFAVRTRLEIAAAEKEAVRRAATLFALPFHAAEGARLIWGTADAIWTALGDTSRDYNWYSKRAILSGVYSATALYWLGDESEGSSASWSFLDRRIDGVMQFEKTKAQIRENRVLGPLLKGPKALLGRIRAPEDWAARAPIGFPGRR